MNLFLSFIRWLVMLPFSLIVLIVSIFLAPVLPVFASKDGWLPKWLWWFQTPDNSLDGDNGFIFIHAPFKGEDLSYIKKYVNRTFWLWRNPSYGFDWGVLAFQPESGHIVKRLYGTKPIAGTHFVSGYFFATITNPDGKMAWQFYVIHNWSASRHAKINLGWKLWSAPDLCQYVVSPHGIWRKT